MTSINYESKDYSTIFQENITDAQEEGLLSDSEDFTEQIKNKEDIENFYVLDLSTHSLSDAKIYESMDSIYNNLDIDKATGEALDNLGSFVHITRREAQRSVAGVVFTLSQAISSDLIIPSGTIVLTSKNERYVTVEDCKILATTTSVTVNAKSELTGYASRVAKNTLTSLETPITEEGATVSVNNPSNAVGGKDIETDDELRVRIKNWTNILEKGTKSAYENYLNNYESLDGYRLLPHWNGVGTLKIIIDCPTESSSTIITELTEGILENVQKYEDDDVTIALVEGITLTNINATINVDIDNVISYSLPQKEEIALKVSNAIKLYVDGGYRTNGNYYTGLLIGEDFIPFQCAKFVAEEVTELKNITFEDDSSFTIDDYQKAKSGVVNVTIE